MDRWWFRLGLAMAAGAIVAVIVGRGLSGIPWHMGFWGTFSLLVILLAGASLALAAVISLMRRRREGSP